MSNFPITREEVERLTAPPTEREWTEYYGLMLSKWQMGALDRYQPELAADIRKRQK